MGSPTKPNDQSFQLLLSRTRTTNTLTTKFNVTMGCSSSQMAKSGTRTHITPLVRMDSSASLQGNDACMMPGGYRAVSLEELDAQQPAVSADAYRRSRGSKLGRADSTCQI